jgi:hypothetical protein
MLAFAAAGCYWIPQEGGVAVAFGIPKELAKVPPDLYTATLTFQEAVVDDSGAWTAVKGGDVYEDSVVVPAFELISSGAMAIKMHAGYYLLTIVLESEDPADPKYGAGPIPVAVPVTSLAKVDVVLNPL